MNVLPQKPLQPLSPFRPVSRSLFSAALLITTLAVTACASHRTRGPGIQQIKAQLADRMRLDPNGELCLRIAARLDRGDIDALGPHINRSALVARALARAKISGARADSWRRQAEEIQNLSRFHFLAGARFFCLGTYPYEDARVLVLRMRHHHGKKWGYLLLRFGGGEPARPFDDYMVLTNGYWHSDLQTFFDRAEAFPRGSPGDAAGLICREVRRDLAALPGVTRATAAHAGDVWPLDQRRHDRDGGGE